jgi:hypothetical protein
MRAFVSGWTGRRLNDSNMTISGENYATAVIDLFNRANTLSEFNSGTYTGVSLYALTLWAKYLPDDSVMKQNGARMIQYTWEAVAELWHPQLKNVAGPWDRSYGFDMNRYLSLLALHLWNVIGKEKSSIIPKVSFIQVKKVCILRLTEADSSNVPRRRLGIRTTVRNPFRLPLNPNPRSCSRETQQLPGRTHFHILSFLASI